MSRHATIVLLATVGTGIAPARARALEVAVAGTRIDLRDGGRTVASFTPRTPPDRRAAPILRETSAQGRRLVEVRLPVTAKGPPRSEVWIAELAGAGASAIVSEVVGARDVDGETVEDVRIDERGVERFQSAVRLAWCDGAQPKLFRKRWDFAARRFRPAPAEPLAPATAAVKARRSDPDAPSVRPLGGFFWTGATTSPAADEARALTAPVALNDGDPGTIWAEGAAGDGRGESLVARRGTSGAPITGLRILPGDTRSGKGYRASARPRRLALLFGPAPDQRVDVELIEDDDGGVARFRQPFWIPLPKPVESSCVTVVLGEAVGEGPTTIADLDVMTAVDGVGGVDRLVDETRQGGECEARVPLLVAIGDAAVEPIAAAIPGTKGAGRECLLDGLARLVAGQARLTPAVAPAFEAALVGASRAEEKLILGALPRLPEPPIAALARLLADEGRPDDDRARAARALAVIGLPDALGALIAAAGSGPPAVRAAVRERLAALPGRHAAEVRAAIAATPEDRPGRRADLLLALGALAGRDPAERAASVEAIRDTYERSPAYEVRHRAIQALGQAGAEAAPTLADLRPRARDPVLRYLATRELAAGPRPVAVPGLRAALDDGDPRVRETAARGLGHQHDREATSALIAAAKQEPWPFVRRAELEALGVLCGRQATDLLVRAVERDVEEVRHVSMTGLVQCGDSRARGILLRVLGHRAESPDLRAHAARLTAGLRDRGAAAALATAVERLQIESQPEIALEGVLVATMQALATLGGPEALRAARLLVVDSRPLLRKVAVEALGRLCAPEAAAALQAAAKDPDEGVAAAAVAAAQRCQAAR